MSTRISISWVICVAFRVLFPVVCVLLCLLQGYAGRMARCTECITPRRDDCRDMHVIAKGVHVVEWVRGN